MNDTISREAVADAINGIECTRHTTWYEFYQKVMTAVEKLPPAELGANLASLGTDAISREDAIKIVQNRCKRLTTGCVLAVSEIKQLPPIQPETAKRIIGKSRGGMTLWYQCNVCNEPVDEKDAYCRGCGRRLIDE